VLGRLLPEGGYERRAVELGHLLMLPPRPR
jgi:hypothetical protein